MRPATILALSLGSFILLPIACTQNFSYFSASMGTGGGSSTTTTHTTSSTTSSATGCMMDSDCDDQNDCTTDACTVATGMCTHTNLPDGMTPPDFTPTPGNCKTEQCMGGMPMMVDDDMNAPMSGNPCVTDGCSMGSVTMTDVGSGMTCGTGNQVCDGMGNCVGCTQSSQCTNPGQCKNVTCTSMKCVVGNSNQGDTCTTGGKVCDGNGNCVACNVNNDCTTTHNCVSNMCVGKDDGQPCGGGGECSSTHCVAGICCNHSCTGTCFACTMLLTGTADGMCNPVTNNTAPSPASQCTAAPCGNTGTCDGAGHCAQVAGGTQCAAATCNGNSFVPAQVCTNNMCPAGTGTDCAAYKCQASGTMCPTTCTMNNECDGTNVCIPGGTCAPPLTNGSMCTDASQCTSTFCYGGPPKTCQADSCGDGATDGAETDQDCGGGMFMGEMACPTCGSGKHCNSGSDCTSGTCNGPPPKTCM